MRAMASTLFLAIVACRGAAPTTPPTVVAAPNDAAAPSETPPIAAPPIEAPRSDTTPSERTPTVAEPVAPKATTRDDELPAYDREQWPHWIDADGDCQDTRTEVLIAESLRPVTFTDAKKCEVASGSWRCPYTDRTFSDPRQLDVDHMVPLAEAYRSGGARWTKQQRTDYANDLSDPDHLVAVYKGANRSKGAKTIAQWLPEEPGDRCHYVETWLHIKTRWKLRVDEAEHAAADLYLSVCAAGGVPEAGKAIAAPREREHEVTDTSQSCCRHCKKGKPCGDACIAADKACHAPPGCACR